MKKKEKNQIYFFSFAVERQAIIYLALTMHITVNLKSLFRPFLETLKTEYSGRMHEEISCLAILGNLQSIRFTHNALSYEKC